MGSIGMVATLSPSVSAVLSAVERNLRKMLETTTGSFNIGGLSQEEFRAFKAEYRTQPAAGFIDGNLLETLLVLDKEDIARVLQGTSEYEAITSHSQEEVMRLVEELQRMH
jgi:DNA damage-binding protein 1